MKLLKTLARSLLAGGNLIVAVTALTAALTALRWQRPAEPCIWVSNPWENDGWTSVFWNSTLAVLFGIAAKTVLLPIPLSRQNDATQIKLTRVICIGLLVLALRTAIDVVVFFRLVQRGDIVSSFPIPLSLGVLGLLTFDLWLIRRTKPESPDRPQSWSRWLIMLIGLTVGQVAMIAGHVLSFGSTDYRRDADVAVVLGARVYADGTLSLALSDRLDTAMELLRNGRVRLILVSGAKGIEGINEAHAMQQYLMKSGILEEHILMDPLGTNTLATARNARELMTTHELRTALVVSHYFHLARCKLLFEEQGVPAVTVPARMSRRLVLEPYFVARECVGYFWYALTRPLRSIPPSSIK